MEGGGQGLLGMLGVGRGVQAAGLSEFFLMSIFPTNSCHLV